MRIIRFSCVLLAALAACQPIDLDKDKFRCSSNADCPSGSTCLASGLCNTGPDLLPDAGACTGPDCTCRAKTCAEVGASCGTLDNGCGGTIECGTCGSGTCNPTTFTCCTARPASEVCLQAQAQRVFCGGVSDGCGGLVDCGTCTGVSRCGGNNPAAPDGGIPAGSVACGCTPTTCAAAGANCGTIQDGCGNTLDCGATCTAGSCGGAGIPNQCGSRATLAAGPLWDHALPTGNDLTDVWTTPDTSFALAVGAGGTVLKLEPNKSWTQLRLPGSAKAISVWGAILDDIWVSSDDAFFYRSQTRGASWTKFANPAGAIPMYRIRGVSTSDIFAVGAQGAIVRWNGSQWNTSRAPASAAPALFALWQTGVGDAWAAGENGTVLHWNGANWQSLAPAGLGTAATGYSLWGTGGSDMWLAASNGLYRWTGSWAVAPGNLPVRVFTSVWGSSPNNVWVASTDADPATGEVRDGYIYRWNGQGFTAHSKFITGGRPITGMSGGPTELYAVGLVGMIARWDGVRFTSNSLTPPLVTEGVSKIAGSSGQDVWVVAPSAPEVPGTENGSLLHFNGVSWGYVPLPVRNQVVAIQAASKILAFAAANDGSDGVGLAWNGTQWVAQIRTPGVQLTTAFGTSPADIWVAGVRAGQTFLSRAGQADKAEYMMPAGTPPIVAMWGAKATDVWAVAGSRLLHWDGRAWTTMSTGLTGLTLRAVHGTATNNVWFVGDAGAVVRWNGTGFNQVPHGAGTSIAFTDVSAAAADDVWVMSANGWMRNKQGTWTATAPQWPFGKAIWAASPTEVFAGGRDEWMPLGRWSGSGSYFERPLGDAQPQALSWAYETKTQMLFSAQGPHSFQYQQPQRRWVRWNGYSGNVTGMWGLDWKDQFITTENGSVYHQTETANTELRLAGGVLNAVWGSSTAVPANDVWAIGTTSCFHWTGSAFAKVEQPCTGNAIHGSAANDIWVVGASSARYNGVTWTTTALPANVTGLGVYVAPPATAGQPGTPFAVGVTPHPGGPAGVYDGVILSWTGSAWQIAKTYDSAPMGRIWGTSASDVWAGGAGLVAHWNGSNWTETSEAYVGVIGLSGNSATDYYIVSQQGAVLKGSGAP